MLYIKLFFTWIFSRPCIWQQNAINSFLYLAFLNSQEATHLIDQLVETLTTNDNEAKCEQECHVLITNQDSVFQHLCPFMCHSYGFFHTFKSISLCTIKLGKFKYLGTRWIIFLHTLLVISINPGEFFTNPCEILQDIVKNLPKHFAFPRFLYFEWWTKTVRYTMDFLNMTI